MSKAPKNLHDLFHDTLRDVYFGEMKIVSTLPIMAIAATSPKLKKPFEKHRTETEGHVKRLKEVFGIIDAKPQAKTCDSINGTLKEGKDPIKDYKGSPAPDVALSAVA